VSDSTIGIKVADGSYYPVIDVEYRGTKKLILTTAKDNQDKVRVDLYKGSGSSLSQAAYIDSLLIENIPPASQGEPEIELLIGIDEEGQLMAEAFDQSTGERQRFDTSITSLPEQLGEEPDFALQEPLEVEEQNLETTDGLEIGEGPDAFDLEAGELETESLETEGLETEGLETEGLEAGEQELEAGDLAAESQGLDLDEAPLTGEDYPVGDRDRREDAVRRGGPNVLLLVLFVILGIALVGAIAYFVYRAISGPAVPPLPSTAAASQVSGSAPSPQAPAQPQAAPAPAVAAAPAAAPAPVAPSAKSVSYRIKKGDTLWDISATYYRNPWLYPRIAKANSIQNPDLIFAGTRITIPEN
jgi:nucleoid-associated protein YgaU